MGKKGGELGRGEWEIAGKKRGDRWCTYSEQEPRAVPDGMECLGTHTSALIVLAQPQLHNTIVPTLLLKP